MSDSVWPHRRPPTRLLCPWDSPGKNTGVGCHFLLQCTKVKSESEVAQSCRTLSDPMDCSLPGSSVHGIFQARVLEWGAIAFSLYTVIYNYQLFIIICTWLYTKICSASQILRSELGFITESWEFSPLGGGYVTCKIYAWKLWVVESRLF